MKVMLVDDHPLFLEGLRNLMETYEFEVVGTAGNGYEAVEKARMLKPDVILMDIELPGCSGIDVITPIKSEIPQVKIVMLTSFDNDKKLFEAIKRGASGYLLKNLRADELLYLLQTLEMGETPLSPGLAARLLEQFARQENERKQDVSMGRELTGRLNQRQIDILNLVTKGMTYKEIGVVMELSERTIKYHMKRIMEALHIENRVQVIAYASREKANPNDC
ncbi:MAG: DNA-binding response regulator [Firmicutes bacterium HGW-Firmicutes-15]|nr:MAG: DNA-binding response regulator [Firmicutes bacterium HGW-Firmicutes-15]